MVKEQLNTFKEIEPIYRGEGSTIYRLPDGRLLKVAKPIVFQTCQALGIKYENKILSTAAVSVKEIVTPLSAVYEGSWCRGYTMEEVSGVDLNRYDDDFTLADRGNLDHFAELYAKIEEVVIKANRVGIIMPDLCTFDNIIIQSDGSLKFIDFDGMQLGSRDKGVALSTSLGNPMKYVRIPKFDSGFCNFTRELDKTSLAILMFLLVFNIDLTKLGMLHPRTGRTITLVDTLREIGLEDREFVNKVLANISSSKKGFYLSDELFKIAANYRMEAMEIPFMKGYYVKRLIRK
jgi:hypothetical protein